LCTATKIPAILNIFPQRVIPLPDLFSSSLTSPSSSFSSSFSSPPPFSSSF
jgi:hypothetical protein